MCAAGERVYFHSCLACARGSTSSAGAVATGADTTCTSILCAANFYVKFNTCTACLSGSTYKGGDPADGPDTTCVAGVCGEGFRVVNHQCVACDISHGLTRPLGDVMAGADTAFGQCAQCYNITVCVESASVWCTLITQNTRVILLTACVQPCFAL